MFLLSLPAAYAQTVNHCSLDSTYSCQSGELSRLGSGHIFETGYQQKAIRLTGDAGVYLPGNIGAQGTISFWYRSQMPTLATAAAQMQATDLIFMSRGREYLQLRYRNDRTLFLKTATVQGGREILLLGQKKLYIAPNIYHHVALSWQRSANPRVADDIRVFIDGEEVSFEYLFSDNKGRDWSASREQSLLMKFPEDPAGVRFNKGTAGTVNYYDEITVTDTAARNVCPLCDRYAEAITIYSRPLFGEEGDLGLVLPSTKPRSGEAIRELSISATKGEQESASFIIFSKNDLANLQVQASDLTLVGLAGQPGQQSTITASAVDVRVVKVWRQSGYGGAMRSGYDLVKSHLRWSEFGVSDRSGLPFPELLVYNDMEDYRENYDPAGRYIPPSISRTFNTEIPEGTSKQFWLTVNVPSQAQPGEYRGTVTVRTTDAVITTFPLRLSVYSFPLASSDKELYIFYRGYLGNLGPPHESLTPEQLRAQLQDIAAAGFNGVMVMNRMSGEDLSTFLRMAKDSGIRHVVQLCARGRCNDISQEKAITEQQGFEPLFYNVDEANFITEPSFEGVLERIYNVHRQQAKIVSTVVYETALAYENPQSSMYQIAPEGQPLAVRHPEYIPQPTDYAVISLPERSAPGRGYERYSELLDGRSDPTPLRAAELYYWQSGMHTPKKNRFNSGVALFLIDADGVAPYVYQHFDVPNRGRGSPFNDFSAGMRNFEGTSETGYVSSQMTTYPSQQGPIPTLEWRAFREGFDDLRYLSTFKLALESLRVSDPAKYRQLNGEFQLQLDSFRDLNAWRYLSDEQFYSLRQWVALRLGELNADGSVTRMVLSRAVGPGQLSDLVREAQLGRQSGGEVVSGKAVGRTLMPPRVTPRPTYSIDNLNPTALAFLGELKSIVSSDQNTLVKLSRIARLTRDTDMPAIGTGGQLGSESLDAQSYTMKGFLQGVLEAITSAQSTSGRLSALARYLREHPDKWR